METQLDQLSADADVALRAEEFDKAEELYLQVLQLDPYSVAAHFAIGSIALRVNDIQRSLDHLKRAAELEPEGVDIAFNLATCLFAGGNRPGALKQLERAAKHCNDDPVFCARIAQMSIRLGEPAAALTLMSRLQRLTPDQQIIVANAHGLLGNWRDAVGILKHLNTSLPSNAIIAEKLSVAAAQLRDHETSIFAFERYLRLVTPTGKDYLRFADLLLIAQRLQRCEHALKLAVEHGEDGAEVYVIKARTARLRADYDAANTALDAAIEREPRHGQAWSARAELADDKQLPELIERLQNGLSSDSDLKLLNHHQQALLQYAMAHMQDRSEDYAAATLSLRQANKIQNVAWAMTNQSYSAEATTEQFNQLIDSYPTEVFAEADAFVDQSKNQISPIFIVGMARSGTTLVERIIGQNSNVFSAGELEAMEFVSTHYHHQLKYARLPKPINTSPDQWAALRQMYLDKLPYISEPVFTDKLPHNFRQVGLILKLFPEARIIQMHRSLQDVGLSIYSHAFSAGHNYATQWDDLKHFYSEAERLMAHWSSLNSPRVLNLNYEDLVQEPARYAQQLVEFCGFEWHESYLDFHNSVTQSFTFSELQVRQPINDKRVARWRNYQSHMQELTQG